MTTKIEAKQFKQTLLNWLYESKHSENYDIRVLVGQSPENLVIQSEKVEKMEDFEPRLINFILKENKSGKYKKSQILLIDNIGETRRSIEFKQKG